MANPTEEAAFALSRAKAWRDRSLALAINSSGRKLSRGTMRMMAILWKRLTYPLLRDKFGDLRTPEEMGWPIKTQCSRCGGRIAGCTHPECRGRGYYFLPLGD